MTDKITIDKTPETIHIMFNMLAPKYDFINNIMSFGTHNYIKYNCIKNSGVKAGDNVIDLCCGTGDMAGFIKKIEPQANVTGIDFSEKMLQKAKIKYKGKNIKFFQGDVTNLPYPDNYFDVITIAFGLRNILNAEKAVEEAYRILKPGGTFVHLDFGNKNFLSKLYDKTTPLLIKLFTENINPYKYLIESKRQFCEPVDLIKDFESKGFKLKKREDYLFSVISSQTMTK